MRDHDERLRGRKHIGVEPCLAAEQISTNRQSRCRCLRPRRKGAAPQIPIVAGIPGSIHQTGGTPHLQQPPENPGRFSPRSAMTPVDLQSRTPDVLMSKPESRRQSCEAILPLRPPSSCWCLHATPAPHRRLTSDPSGRIRKSSQSTRNPRTPRTFRIPRGNWRSSTTPQLRPTISP